MIAFVEVQTVKLLLLSKCNPQRKCMTLEKMNKSLLEGKPIKHNPLKQSGTVFPFAVSPFSFSCFHPPAVMKVLITTPMLKLC